MDSQFISHNLHLQRPESFATEDPQLRRLHEQPYVHLSPQLLKLPVEEPGIYTLSGGRQVGKTTLLKQWMAHLLVLGITPHTIRFFSGELIDNHHTLLHILRRALDDIGESKAYLIIDEVTYIRDWDKAIKYAADAGWLDQAVVVLTGSDWVFLQEARMRFPGRRGQATVVDFYLYPLSFFEATLLKYGKKIDASQTTPDSKILAMLDQSFKEYLIHGGYLTAMNDMAKHQKIMPATLTTYADWIRGDVLKRGKQEHYLKEVLQALLKRLNTQVSFNALAKDLSIDHPKTVSDYLSLLADMDVIFIQSALLEHKLLAAPKKAKRLMFTDPFIHHAVAHFLAPQAEPFAQQIQVAVDDVGICAALVEACVITHYRRRYKTYYIKAEGEVDLAYLDQQRFWPIEIKWQKELSAKTLKQILKYDNGKILCKHVPSTWNVPIPVESLVWHLWQLRGLD